MRKSGVLVLAVGLAVPVQAQSAPSAGWRPAGAEACAPLSAALGGWRSPAPLQAAGAAGRLDLATLTVGRAVTLSLLPAARVAYPLRPEKPGAASSFGGLARVTVPEGGTWRVALGSGAWVDVVREGKAAPSVAHAHGPACSGIRKMVDYQLTPGTYTLQLSGSASDKLAVMVTRIR